MEAERKFPESREADILFSRTVKAGQRIYYIDVKRNRRDEMYLCVTESKKMLSGDSEMPQVSFEKHKIFLFPEDFGKFREALGEAFGFVEGGQGAARPRADREEPTEENEEADSIKIDLDF